MYSIPQNTNGQRVLILKDGTRICLFNHRRLSRDVVLGQIIEALNPERLNKLVAVKKIYEGKGGKEALEEESKKLQSISNAKCSNKVSPIYGQLLAPARKHRQETHAWKLYIFSPLLKSGSGEKLKETLTTLSFEQKCERLQLLAQDLLEGLQSLHQEHIYHLDFKPANFMLNEQEEQITVEGQDEIEIMPIQREMAVIIDFDCAQKSDDGRIYSGRGNIKYYSPQRWDVFRHLYIKYGQGVMDNGISITAPSSYEKEYYLGDSEDAWALGVTLLELLLGKNPFAEGVTDHYPGIKSIAEGVNKGTPEWFQTMVNRLEDTYNWFKTPTYFIIHMIKGLLVIDSKKRLTISEALQAFQDPNPIKRARLISAITHEGLIIPSLVELGLFSVRSSLKQGHLSKQAIEKLPRELAQKCKFKGVQKTVSPVSKSASDKEEEVTNKNRTSTTLFWQSVPLLPVQQLLAKAKIQPISKNLIKALSTIGMGNSHMPDKERKMEIVTAENSNTEYYAITLTTLELDALHQNQLGSSQQTMTEFSKPSL